MDNKQKLVKKMIETNHRRPSVALMILLLAAIIASMGLLTYWLFKIVIIVIDRSF